MANWYGFEKDGTLNWNINDGTEAPLGTMDYLGNGYILMTNTVGVDLWSVDATQAVQEKRMITFAANVDGLGIAIDHSRVVEGTHQGNVSDPGFDGKQCILATQTAGEAIGYQFYLADYQGGDLDRVLLALGTNVPTGIGWNGKDFWSKVTNADGTLIYHYDLGTGTAKLNETSSHNTGTRDFAFDGQHFWVIGAAVIRSYNQQNWATHDFSFAHGLTNPQGMTTDGQQLIVVTA